MSFLQGIAIMAQSVFNTYGMLSLSVASLKPEASERASEV